VIHRRTRGDLDAAAVMDVAIRHVPDALGTPPTYRKTT
jgi:hypothetical protein